MLSYFIPAEIALVFVAFPLLAGAWSDHKTRTFPEQYWVFPSRVAGFFLFISYLLMIADGLYWQTALLVVCSVVAAVFFAFMGYRFGSGGDWRALIYISLLAPTVLFTFTFWVALGIMSLLVAVYTLENQNDSLHPFKRQIPWSLAICVGYCVTLAFILFTGGAG